MRVVAVRNTDDDGTVYIFGRGEYVGDEVPPEDIVFMGVSFRQAMEQWVKAGMVKDMEEARERLPENPKIVLDNGKVVWGCECWWGSEERFNEGAGKGVKVVEVSIDEYREEGRRAAEEMENTDGV